MIIKTNHACDCGDYCEWCSVVTPDLRFQIAFNIAGDESSMIVGATSLEGAMRYALDVLDRLRKIHFSVALTSIEIYQTKLSLHADLY